MTVNECAEATGARVIQVFVRANRMFADNQANAVSDYTIWCQDMIVPTYVQEYCEYVEGLCPVSSSSVSAQ